MFIMFSKIIYPQSNKITDSLTKIGLVRTLGLNTLIDNWKWFFINQNFDIFKNVIIHEFENPSDYAFKFHACFAE